MMNVVPSLPSDELLGLAGVVARVVLGGVFMLAGAFKWRHKSDAKPLIEELGFDPNGWLTNVLAALPFVEVSLGTWLLVGKAPGAAIGVALSLLVAMTSVLVLLLRKGYAGNCACFGSLDTHRIGPVHLGRNGILTIAAVFACFQAKYTGHAVWALPLEIILMAAITLAAMTIAYLVLLEVQDLHRHTITGNQG